MHLFVFSLLFNLGKAHYFSNGCVSSAVNVEHCPLEIFNFPCGIFKNFCFQWKSGAASTLWGSVAYMWLGWLGDFSLSPAEWGQDNLGSPCQHSVLPWVYGDTLGGLDVVYPGLWSSPILNLFVPLFIDSLMIDSFLLRTMGVKSTAENELRITPGSRWRWNVSWGQVPGFCFISAPGRNLLYTEPATLYVRGALINNCFYNPSYN